MSLWETFISHGVYGGPNLYKEWDFILRSVLKIDWDVGILYLRGLSTAILTKLPDDYKLKCQ